MGQGGASVLYGLSGVYPFDLQPCSFLCHQLVLDSTTQPPEVLQHLNTQLSLFSNGSEFTILRGLRGDEGLQSQHWPGKRLAQSDNGACSGQGSKMVPKIPAPGVRALHNLFHLSGAKPGNKTGFHPAPVNEIGYIDIAKRGL